MNKRIKYLVMDVDGTLTDGKIYMGANGELMKAFDIKDGYGIHDLLPNAGIVPVIITGRVSAIVQNRCKELGIGYFFQGISDKKRKLLEFLNDNNGDLSDVAYVGDDLNDLSCMQFIKDHGGLVGAPANSSVEIRRIADYVTTARGGDGAVREFIGFLLS